MAIISNLTQQVLKNCDIADAQHAGFYSLCGLVLRLRDLYKWEKKLKPWQEDGVAEVSEWIDRKETCWESLVDTQFEKLTFNQKNFDPLDAEGLNAHLNPLGICYGSGYAHFLKPTFFLAEITAKKIINDTPVYILGHEYARDLFTTPALTQNGQIFVRLAAARFWLWDQISYVKQSGRAPMQFALASYGITDINSAQMRRTFETIAAAETTTYLYHELGELADTYFDRDIWRAIIAAFPHSPIEMLARAIKDVLADTHPGGTLAHLIKNRKSASLGFYIAFRESFTQKLFPALGKAFESFMVHGDWQHIEEARQRGFKQAHEQAKKLVSIFLEGQKQSDLKHTRRTIDTQILAPIGLGTKP
jgi:hypothetical protein